MLQSVAAKQASMQNSGRKPGRPTKVYVAVEVTIREDGYMLPTQITWENGVRYEIDRVLDIRQAPALRAGGQGDRYTVKINGRQTYLFFERCAVQGGPIIGRWFVERRGQ